MTTYKEAGVDIENTDALVEDISELSKSTNRNGNFDKIGGFGGIFDLKNCGYEDPLLVSGTDGIGTKILLGIETDILDGLGHDLVGMCLNDILCHGAEPLFFLDYYASSKIDKNSFLKIMKSITEACKINNCSLIGGETAEMPGLYKKDDFDFAGFCVGAVERKKILPKRDVMKEDDLLYGIRSSGFHSNGYSLIRKVLKDKNIDLHKETEFKSSYETNAAALMAPTKLYFPFLKKILTTNLINGISHITGGGIVGNAPRMLSENLSARKAEFANTLQALTGRSDAQTEVEQSIQRLFFYAAWSDKFDGSARSVPLKAVALVMKEAIGNCGVLCDNQYPLLGFISVMAPLFATGNRSIIIPSETFSPIVTDFYQILDTSDVPPGTINILTGKHADLAIELAGHMDIESVWSFSPSDVSRDIEKASVSNLKRTWVNNGCGRDWNSEEGFGREFLENATENKTIWIPYGE